MLQSGVELPVFGTATDGEKVTVKFGGQEASTVAMGGAWMLKLKPMPPSAEPRSMVISGGSGSVTLRDMLVGDV